MFNDYVRDFMSSEVGSQDWNEPFCADVVPPDRVRAM